MKPTYVAPAGLEITRAPRVRVEALIAFYCVASTLLPLISPLFKALPYANPFMCLVGALATRRLSMPPNAPPYFLLIVAGFLAAPFSSLRGVQDSWLMLAGLSPFLFGYRFEVKWSVFFSLAIAATVIPIAISGGTGRFVFDPLNSSSSFESSGSFLFAIAAMWAAYERRWGRVVFSLFLTLLTLKRIAVLAALFGIAALVLPRRLVDKLLRPVPMLIINGIAIALAIAYGHGDFDHWISSTTGQSANQFGMGRQYLYGQIVKVLIKNPTDFIFYGVGPGGAYELVSPRGLERANLHNDSLKILAEYGVLVWAGFFGLMFRWRLSIETRAMMLFSNVLLLTDNTLIYVPVICAMSLVLTRVSMSHEPLNQVPGKRGRRIPAPSLRPLEPALSRMPGAGTKLASNGRIADRRRGHVFRSGS
jgi:hypothetical protein